MLEVHVLSDEEIDEEEKYVVYGGDSFSTYNMECLDDAIRELQKYRQRWQDAHSTDGKEGRDVTSNISYPQRIRGIVLELTQVLMKIRDTDTISGNDMFLKQCKALLDLAEEMDK